MSEVRGAGDGSVLLATEVAFDVPGLPPAKNEAISMLGKGHSHRERVVRLLRAVHEALVARPFAGWEPPAMLGLELSVSGPATAPSDASNYLGGVADVLEAKDRRGEAVLHLDELVHVSLYRNDSQIRVIRYTEIVAPESSYRVHLWQLDPYCLTSAEEARRVVVDHLTAIRARPELIDAAGRGIVADVACAMPECYCPDGRGYFEPRRHPPGPWDPTPDHFPVLDMDGGQLDVGNIRLAHGRCNKLDYSIRSARDPVRRAAVARRRQAQEILQNTKVVGAEAYRADDAVPANDRAWCVEVRFASGRKQIVLEGATEDRAREVVEMERTRVVP